MRIYLIIVLILSFLLGSCENDSVSVKNTNIIPVDNVQVIDSIKIQDTISLTSTILMKIKELPDVFLPEPVKLYLQNSKDVKFSLFNDNSAGFITNTNGVFSQVKIQYLKNYTGIEMLGFCFYKKQNGKFISSFFFVQKNGNSWSNSTQLVLNNSLLKEIEKQIGTSLTYVKQDGLYAYQTDASEHALLFDFSSDSKIFISVNSSWVPIANLTFSDGVFHILDNDISSSVPAKMLNSRELDTCSHYYTLNSALLDSNNVHIVDFSSIGLTNLDSKIAKLNNLQIIILNDNFLTNLPDKFTELSKLQILRANNNYLEKLPDNFDELTFLEEISVSNNKITDLPEGVFNIVSLKVLNIDHNLLENIDYQWKGLTNLVILNLSNNNISELPASIGDLENLISLDISNNPINNLPDEIYSLKNLAYIDVTNTEIPDDQIVELMGLNAEITVISD